MRLIDADALIEDIRKNSASYWADDFAHEWVDKQPTINTVPVVQCKDCKFYYQMTAETGICELACRHLGNDGFCSEGERNENNDNIRT